MEQIEIIGKRKPREKHYLKENGIIEAQLFDQDIHFLKNGIYEEIDNTLIKKNEIYENRNNSYKVQFNVNNENNKIYKIEKGEYYLEFFLNKHNKYNEEIVNKSKTLSEIIYHNILKNVDLKYEIISSEIKESIILNDKNNDIDELCFDIKTNLNLKIDFDGSIIATYEKNVIFKFDTPYMIDSENNINKKISYNLIKDEDIYQLFMFVDKKWLETTAKYPVIIDPTITNYSNESSVIDTYIFPNDTNVSRGNLNYLKVGVEKSNNLEIVNRALLKFDLPVIGTGSQVVSAKLCLNNYPYLTTEVLNDIINVHRVTKDWNESSANWENMNDAYDKRVDGAFNFYGSYTLVDGKPTIMSESADITSLVQKWYTSTPNYGIMLKLSREVYNMDIIPLFFSNNYKVTSGDNPKPILIISYRNQNGLESYMNYESHSFCKAKIYHNSYNGNLTTVYDIGTTSPGKLPINISLIYNTNDVILNKNRGYGIGYKLNLNQTIKEVIIDNKTYLEYEDEDGTIHYFLDEKIGYDEVGNQIKENEENTFYDEDGLELKIKKYDDKFILKDKNNNEMSFTKYNGIGYLTEIKDVSGNINNVFYDAEYKKIMGVMDANGSIINIIYNSNYINIVSPTDTVILSLLGENILSGINFSDDSILITANDKYLMTSLTNASGRKIEYEYYSETPYKLKKVMEYGTDGSLGNSYTTIYGFNSTTFVDSKGKRKVITYNSSGNPESISTMKKENDITDAYGSKSDYGKTFEEFDLVLDKNKLLSSQIPIKYVKNLLTNTSFENGESLFKSGQNGVGSISDEYSHNGLKSLKFEALYVSIEAGVNQEVDVGKGKYYTFSAYIRSGRITSNAFLRMHYEDFEGRYKEAVSETIIPDENFERLDVTIFYPSNAKGKLNLEVCLDGRGFIYIDDVQLEEGEVVNNYNMIENSDFSNGINDWNLTSTDYVVNDVFKIVDINSQKALKLDMFTNNGSSIEKTFDINGKAGDNFTLAFWYKNTGLVGQGLFTDGPQNVVSITFYPADTEYGGDMIENYSLNPNENDWQYFIHSFVSDYDFKKIKLSISQNLNANEFYITNINLFRDVRSVKYNYDENGNIVSTKNLNDKMSIYKYDKNNELIKMTDPKGKIIYYEYDNVITNRVLRGISETGISNEIEYDAYDNPIITRIIDRGIMLKPKNGEYIIRLKGTTKIIRLINNAISISNDYHSHDKWKIEKVIIDSTDYYKISHSFINDKYLTVSNDTVILTGYQNDNSLFELIIQGNGSHLLKSKSASKYIKIENDNFVLADLIEDDHNYQFYFESNDNPIFIENSAEYTDDGRFITKVIDTNLNETNFEIDDNTNLIKSIINSKNQVINYNYNSQKQLESIENKDNKIIYEYNDNNMVSKINQNNRIFKYEYDNFFNLKKIYLGENLLVENEYELNNGKLKSIKYGNDQILKYEYDDFDRITKLIKNDEVFNYKYNNNGDLVKIDSDKEKIKFMYDLSKKLYKYQSNDFKAKYTYDDNNNIIKKEYDLNGKKYTINKEYNGDDALVKLIVDSKEFNYIYDGLGRLKSSDKDGKNKIDYSYVSRGNRTSNLIKNILNETNKYTYEYDEIGNIIKIFYNDKLQNEYFYDDYNELIREDNYLLNKTIKYNYDHLGNLLSNGIYELKSDSQINRNIYEYKNENWIDQLTKYNNDKIIYDKIGNPIKIGEDINMDWINGRQLNHYQNAYNDIYYKYNVYGTRNSKIVNNVETKYYYEDNKIIFEQTDTNVLYYIRSDVDGLKGFKYNDNIYYYIKNNQDDIVGILDNEFNVVANYLYDSWGNIISITDESGNDISNENEHIANINPYRYRSYYYDKETGLYYLKTRYYNPKWGRFINSDGVIVNSDVIKGNLYSYCANDPINNIDKNGCKSKKKKESKFKNFMNGVYNFLKKTIDRLFSHETVTSKDSLYIPVGNVLGVLNVENRSSTLVKVEKSGSSKSLIKITDTTPEKMIDWANLKINFSSTEISTNNQKFDFGIELGEGEPKLNFYKKIDDSVTGTLSVGVTLFGSLYFDKGNLTNDEEDDDIQISNTTRFSINVVTLALAYVTLTELSLSWILKTVLFNQAKKGSI